jgi:hypothetical protein
MYEKSMKLDPFEFSTCSLGLLLTGIKAIFDQFPWPITYLPASSHFRPVPLAYYLPASSYFRPVPLAYYLPASKPFSTSSLGLLPTYWHQAIFDQFPWPITYIPASSQDLKSRKLYFIFKPFSYT